MQENNDKEISVDVLKHIENLSNKINELMKPKAHSILRRYPITFGILILFGVIALHEGLKGILEKYGLLEMNPWSLLIIGILILIVTGTIYKKLDK